MNHQHVGGTGVTRRRTEENGRLGPAVAAAAA
ncbi:hypothetical protein QFZ40_002667 [Arthrobacter pascens]|nr:hypothetical protein [Arthrobacter pascens]